MSSAGREEKEGSAGQEREGRGPERDGKTAQGNTGEKAHGGGRVESVSRCDEHCGACLSKQPYQKFSQVLKMS